MTFRVIEQYRIRTGALVSRESDGNNGAFLIPASAAAKRPFALFTIASDGEGWEHVSVSTPERCPTWNEMCFVKSLFWDNEDCVIQFHPPRSDYVNMHKFCLHLWRPVGSEILTPPSFLVGFK